VTGRSSGGPDVELDLATVKYAPDGTELWVERWGGAGSEWPTRVAVDARGDVYVAGGPTSMGKRRRITSYVKYSAHGEELWSKRWNGPGSGNDLLTALVLDGGGNLILTGNSGERGETPTTPR